MVSDTTQAKIDDLCAEVERLRASTINWTRYDGTPDTLPKTGDCVLLSFDGKRPWFWFYGVTLDYLPHWHTGGPARFAEIGDMWAPWPAAPRSKRR